MVLKLSNVKKKTEEGKLLFFLHFQGQNVIIKLINDCKISYPNAIIGKFYGKNNVILF